MTDQMNRIIMPDFNNDVVWRPPRMGGKLRSISTTEEPTKINSEFGSPRERRTSITEMFFGSSRGQQQSIGGIARRTSLSTDSDLSMGSERHMSITETRDFKEFIRRQQKILEDQ